MKVALLLFLLAVAAMEFVDLDALTPYSLPLPKTAITLVSE